jgi:hypothetical protein
MGDKPTHVSRPEVDPGSADDHRDLGGSSPKRSSAVAPHRSVDNRRIYFSKFPKRMFVPELQGRRDLVAALVQLADWQRQQPEDERTLWTSVPKMTRTRVAQEWTRFRQVIRPEIADHLGLVVLAKDGPWTALSLEDADKAAEEARALLPTFKPPQQAERTEWSAPTPKFFSVWKVLLRAWLKNEGPLTAIEIGARSDSSSPTVAAALSRLRRRDEIPNVRNQPVELVAFPRATLREILALSDSLRRPHRYVDASGRPPDPERLLKSILEHRPHGVSIGGVAAARHYYPRFDLNGLPRLDLVTTPDAGVDWLRKLDPALRPTNDPARSPVLVVHPTDRLVDASEESSPWADPVETLLDLHELRLGDQAEDFVRSLRHRQGAT